MDYIYAELNDDIRDIYFTGYLPENSDEETIGVIVNIDNQTRRISADLSDATKELLATHGDEIVRVEGKLDAEISRAETTDAAIIERLDTAEGDIDILETRATDIEGRLDAIEGDEGLIKKGDAATLEAAKGYTNDREALIRSELKTAYEGYADGVAATAKSEAISESNGYADGIVAGLKTTLEAADLAINNKIGSVTEGKTVVSMIGEAQAAAKGYAKEYADDIVSIEKTAREAKDLELEGKINENAAAISNEATARENADTVINEKFGAAYSKDATIASAIADAKKAGTDADTKATNNASRLDVVEDKVATLEIESAKHALKSDVEAELANKVNVSDYETYQDTVTEALKSRYTKSEVDSKFETLNNVVSSEQSKLSDLTTRVSITEGNITSLQGIVETGTDSNANLRGAITELQTLTGADGAIRQEIAANKAAIEKEVSDRDSAISGVVADYKAADLAIDNKIGTVLEDKTVVGMIDEAQIAAVQSAASALSTAVQTLSTKDTELVAEDARLAGLIGDNTDAIAAEAEARIDAINTINSKLDVEKVSTAIATAKSEAIAAAKSETDGQVSALTEKVNKNTGDISTLSGTVTSEIARVEGLVTAEETRAKGVEADFEGRIAEIEVFFKEEKVDGALNTLYEIQDYIDTHDGAVETMISNINANTAKIGALETTSATHAEKTYVDEELAKKIDATAYNAKVAELANSISGQTEALTAETAVREEEDTQLYKYITDNITSYRVFNQADFDKLLTIDNVGKTISYNDRVYLIKEQEKEAGIKPGVAPEVGQQLTHLYFNTEATPDFSSYADETESPAFAIAFQEGGGIFPYYFPEKGSALIATNIPLYSSFVYPAGSLGDLGPGWIDWPNTEVGSIVDGVWTFNGTETIVASVVNPERFIDFISVVPFERAIEIEVIATPIGEVLSVNGLTGDVVLSKEDIGLSQVDNTPDSEKEVAYAERALKDAAGNEIAATYATSEQLAQEVDTLEAADTELNVAISAKLATDSFNAWKDSHEADHAKTATAITAEITAAINDEKALRENADTLINEKFGANYSKDATVASAIADAKQAGIDAVTAHNASAEAHADIRAAIPTKTSQLTNDSGFLTSVPEINYCEEITYAELKVLRDSSGLVPGMNYRITDYVTTTSQPDTQSAGHLFDIIVTALSANTLSETASVDYHSAENDTYFADAKLEAWEIKYCLDNDKTRFMWADEENGKGVIYYMKDEWNNECPYDFKNIQFKRYKVTEVANGISQSFVYNESAGQYYYYGTYDDTFGWNPIGDFTIDLDDFIWCYTFMGYPMNVSTGERGEWQDGSLESPYRHQGDIEYRTFMLNNIKPYICSYDKDLDYNNCGLQRLNNIVLYGYWEQISTQEGYPLTQAFCCHNNKFEYNCFNITFGDQCHSNTFGTYCENNVFNSWCFSNTFGNGCWSNILGDDCCFNTFSDCCDGNTFDSNDIGNTFGVNCGHNTFGTSCDYIALGNNCEHILPSSYCRHLIIENGVRYINLSSNAEETSSKFIQNVKVCVGVSGASTTNPLVLTVDRGLEYETKFVASGSKEVII